MNQLPTLQSKRLLLRPFQLSDATDVQRLAGEKEVAATTLNIPHPYLDGMAESWIATHADQFEENNAVTLAILLKEDAILVGAIGLTNVAPNHQAEMGYWIGKPYWNHGFCTEAAARLIRYAFDDMGLIRIHAHHLHRNPASGRVMRKLGMQHEGTLRQHVKQGGLPDDVEFYGILQHEIVD